MSKENTAVVYVKELIISKELVSEVLGLNVVYTESCEHRDGIIGIWTDMNTKPIEEINIYEFAFKCKEWARDRYNITISSSLYKNYAKSWNIDKDKSYTAKTEVEVIIKACEEILKDSK